MDNAVKAIIIGASIVITLVVVTLGFVILRQGQETARVSIGQLSDLTSSVAESNLTMYDGLEVSGSEVVNLLRQYRNDKLAIRVATKKGASIDFFYTLEGSTIDYRLGTKDDDSISRNKINHALDVANVNYIYPNGRFEGTVVRDKNGAIIALLFNQK